MRHALAVAWLVVVVASAVYLTFLGMAGFPIRSDLLALVPQEEHDPVLQRAKDAVSRSVGRRILLAFGDTDRTTARSAARQVGRAVARTGLVDALEGASLEEAGRRLGALYFPHREALLTPRDRATLEAGHGEDIARRALVQAFGFGSPVDARLLAADPFLLLASFLNGLPSPVGKLAIDEGMLTTTEGPLTWVVVPMTLRQDAFDMDVQQQLVDTLDAAVAEITRTSPGLKVLRLGALFYADDGSRTATDEIWVLTVIETVGTILLIVGVFRRLSPLVLNMLALTVGIAVAFAATFLVFGEVHVAALLFGTSLIGVAVDYGLHYCATAFGEIPFDGRKRLHYVLPGITLGLLTTLIGYAALALAPFPGLKQIAVFALCGLVGAFATVTLWFPLLDRVKPLRHGASMLYGSTLPWVFWSAPHLRVARLVALLGCLAILVAGLARFHTDDDVRRLQALSPRLVEQQEHLTKLVGATPEAQHLLIVADSDETALQREEALIPDLDRLVAQGALAGYQVAARYVPSLARQASDRALIHKQLVGPLLEHQIAQFGLSEHESPPVAAEPLTLAAFTAAGTAAPVADLVVAPGVHVVRLLGPIRAEAVRAAVAGHDGVRFVDPTGDFSRLLGAYRNRAILLTVISLALVSIVLTWRYGLRGAFWTVLPPIIAALLVPAVLSLGGEPFTFFHAMGLVLVVAIGVDYTIFCAETPPGHHSVTMLAILLATITTLLSFGLLSASSAVAVRSFGFTMLVGIIAAYFLAPIASRAATPDRHLFH
jgi:predicted exporter